MASNDIKREINLSEAKIYLNNGLINSNHQTWFKNVFQVKPGSYMEINDDRVVEKKYYELKKILMKTFMIRVIPLLKVMLIH